MRERGKESMCVWLAGCTVKFDDFKERKLSQFNKKTHRVRVKIAIERNYN